MPSGLHDENGSIQASWSLFLFPIVGIDVRFRLVERVALRLAGGSVAYVSVVGIRLHEFRYFVDGILRGVDFVEIVHPAGKLRRDRALRSAFFLLEVTLALLTFGRGRGAEVSFASGAFAGSAGAGRAKPTGARTAEAA